VKAINNEPTAHQTITVKSSLDAVIILMVPNSASKRTDTDSNYLFHCATYQQRDLFNILSSMKR
jgi:hypothetical protein